MGTYIACFIVYCLSCWGLYFVFGCFGYLDCFPVAVVCLMRCGFCGGASARGCYLLLFCVFMCCICYDWQLSWFAVGCCVCSISVWLLVVIVSCCAV